MDIYICNHSWVKRRDFSSTIFFSCLNCGDKRMVDMDTGNVCVFDNEENIYKKLKP